MREIPLTRNVFLIVMICAAFLLFFKLGQRPLRNPDEGRYAKISQEMLESGDWVRPTLYGIEYLRKPPLYYWLIAGSMKIFGQNETAARAVGALAAFLILLMTAGFAHKAVGPRPALCAAMLLATNYWFIHVGRYLVIDMLFCLGVVGALLAYYRWQEQPKSMPRLSLFYLLLAMAVLTKGILGLALPAAAVMAHLIFTRQDTASWLRLRPFFGALVILALVGPWFLAISRRESDFWNIFFIREHWQRATLSGFEHQEPWFFYPLMLAAFFFPFCLHLPALGRLFLKTPDGASVKNPIRFLIVSSVAMLALLSVSKSKLATYLLPVIPLVSVLLGIGFARWIGEDGSKRPHRFEDRYLRVLMIVLILLSIPLSLLRQSWMTPFGFVIPIELVGSLRQFGWCLLAGSTVSLAFLIRRQRWFFFITQVVTSACIILSIQSAMLKINPDYSTKDFAGTLREQAPEKSEVFIYGHPGAFYDFGFYLGRPVRLVGLAGEMEIVRPKTEHDLRYVTREAFDGMILKGVGLYCLIRKSDYVLLPDLVKARTRILRQNARKILFETTPGPSRTGPS